MFSVNKLSLVLALPIPKVIGASVLNSLSKKSFIHFTVYFFLENDYLITQSCLIT